MRLNDFTPRQIEAAMKLKGIKVSEIAKELQCSSTTVRREIKGTQIISSERINSQIFDLLKTELIAIRKVTNEIQPGDILQIAGAVS